MKKRDILLLSVFILLSFVAMSPVYAVTYTFADLGELPGGSASLAEDINDFGQVVGWALSDSNLNNKHAVIWEDGTINQLTNGFLPYGINNSGQVAGEIYLESGLYHACLWDNGEITDLGTLGGTLSRATEINASGQIVGWALPTTGGSRAFLWSNGTMQNLGTLGGIESLAYGINDSGWVVGHSRTKENLYRAFLWNGAGMIELPRVSTDWKYSAASDINSSGQITGRVFNSGTSLACVWDNVNVVHALDILPGWSQSQGCGINDIGQVVGFASDPNGDKYACLWDNGVMYDLNTLIEPGSTTWKLREARSINDTGQIVGYASSGSFSYSHAFLLTPVGGEEELIPEPASLLLLGFGVLGVIFIRKRIF